MKFFTLKLTLFILTSGLAIAGSTGGHGGGAFVCKNTNGQVTRAVSYDLWRGENEKKFLINKINNLSAEEQVYRAIHKSIIYSEKIKNQLEPIADEMVLKFRNELSLNAKVRNLGRQNDFTPSEAPLQTFCPQSTDNLTFETAALYNDELEELKLSTELVKSFESQTDLAGLILHEIIYKWMRNISKDVSANEVFDITSVLLSNEDDSKIAAILNNNKLMSTFTKNIENEMRDELLKEFIKAKTPTEMRATLKRKYFYNNAEYEINLLNYFYDSSPSFLSNYRDSLTLLTLMIEKSKVAHVNFLIDIADINQLSQRTVLSPTFFEDQTKECLISPLVWVKKEKKFKDKLVRKYFINLLEGHCALKIKKCKLVRSWNLNR